MIVKRSREREEAHGEPGGKKCAESRRKGAKDLEN